MFMVHVQWSFVIHSGSRGFHHSRHRSQRARESPVWPVAVDEITLALGLFEITREDDGCSLRVHLDGMWTRLRFRGPENLLQHHDDVVVGRIATVEQDDVGEGLKLSASVRR